MNEELLNNEANKAEIEKIEKIKDALNKLENKKSKFLFCVPDVNNPNASVYEIYFHATVVKKLGYNVNILTEKEDYKVPKWLDSEITNHEFIPLSNNKLTVGPEDIMIIPEVFSNIMEQTKNLPCIRIGLLQSIDYKLNALVPGTDWKNFGINDIITTSTTLKEFIETYFGKNKFNIEVYNPSIPDYFNRDDAPKKPIISVIGRNPNEISKLVKLFFSRYPQYRWVTFDPMLTKSKPPQAMRRKDFAKRLKENFAAIWIDRISSWGTFPLECMKSGTIPIGLIPDITPEYLLDRNDKGEVTKLKENSGIWTDNFYQLPVLIGETLIKFLDDGIDDKIYDDMEKIASEYTPENAENQLVKIYNNLIEKRKEVLKNSMESITDNPKKIIK